MFKGCKSYLSLFKKVKCIVGVGSWYSLLWMRGNSWYLLVISRGLQRNIMRNTIMMNETGLDSAKSCRHHLKIASRFKEISFVIDNNNNRQGSQLDESKAGREL